MTHNSILMVDDSAIATHCYQLLLADYPQIDGTFTTRGDEALRLITAATQAFDLVLLDQGLPDIDGLILAKALRRAGVRCPILIVSATRILPLVQREYIGIIQRFYVKPLTPYQFQGIVRRYVCEPVAPF